MPKQSRINKQRIENLVNYRLLRAKKSLEIAANRDTDQALTMCHKGPKEPKAEKPYKCDVCNKSMNHVSHKMKPTGEKTYKCDDCEKMPRRKRKSFFQAQKQLLKAQELSEFVTNRDTDQALTMNHKSHRLKPTRKKPYKRDVCEKIAKRRRIFFQAQKQLHQTQDFSEFVTNPDTDQAFTLNHKSHKIKPTGKKPYKRDVGEKSMNHKNHTSHTKQHAGRRKKITFHCGICGLGFDMIRKLGSHIRKHKTEKPFECDVCGKHSSKLLYHTEHMRIHTVEKPFKCDVCGKGFIKPNVYKDHKKQHTGENPFHCGICGLGFDMTSQLGSHMKIHKVEKPYECDVCGMCFSKLHFHTEHVRLHAGEKTYKCDVCGKCFIAASEFEVHSQTQCYSVSMSDQPAKRARINLTLDMKHKIICEYEKDPSQTWKDLGTKYGLGYKTVAGILKRKDDIIRTLAINNNNHNRKRVVSKHLKFEQVNKMTYDWFVSARSRKVPMSGPFIKSKASKFADEMKIVGFKATRRWLEYWKSCYNIKDFNEAV